MSETQIKDKSFNFEKTNHEYDLSDSEVKSFLIKDREGICEWAEKNIELVPVAYALPGKFTAWPWQREPLDSFLYWDRIIFIGATRTFKSGMAELMIMYAMSTLSLSGMLAYANDKTVEDMFSIRLVPMIKKNKLIRELWDGKDDSLTSNKLMLNNCLWKIASANNQNDLSSFDAPITIGSEVGKWQKKKFNPVTMLRGRQDAHLSIGIKKNLLESSPYEVGDYLYKETFREGTLIVEPHIQCPLCGEWQVLTDYQIVLKEAYKEIRNPALIRDLKYDAVEYLCRECKKEITENERARAAGHVVWASAGIDQDDFKQEREKIDKDGNVAGRLQGGRRRGYDTIAFCWNRLVDLGFPFYECLARFFDSLSDTEKKKVYENETMTRWYKPKNERINTSYLETKKLPYYQYGDQHRIPEDVLVLTIGVDSQDAGYFYGIFGWGYALDCFLIRHGFIECDIKIEKNHQKNYLTFKTALCAEPLLWHDGTAADWRFGLIDRGGHRDEDVDYIASHFNNLKAYIGSPRTDDSKSHIYKSDKGDWYMGQPERLSDFTGTILAGEYFHLPDDVGSDFLAQVVRQFREKRMGKDGIQKETWIHDYQGEDHYRDCYDEKTEVMTSDGFKLFKDITTYDDLATVNLETQFIEYQKPFDLIQKKYIGEMVQIGGGIGQNTDVCITPNHRMVVYYGEGGKIEKGPFIKKAKDLNNNNKLMTRAKWEGTKCLPIVFEQIGIMKPCSVDAEIMAHFLGWYISEGSCQITKGNGKHTIISQCNEDGKNKIRKLLNSMPWNFCEIKNGFVLTNPQIYNYISNIGNAYTKRVPEWIKNATPEIINCFLESAIDGDGWTDRNQVMYATVCKKLADDIQELFIKTGFNASVRKRKAHDYFIKGRHGTNTVDQYYVMRRHAKCAHLRNSKGDSNIKKIDYDGMVYCASVPNGTLIVRRNGKVVICGNCFNLAWAALKLTKLDKALFNENLCNTLKEKRIHKIITEPKPTQEQKPDTEHKPHSSGGYFSRDYRRRFR